LSFNENVESWAEQNKTIDSLNKSSRVRYNDKIIKANYVILEMQRGAALSCTSAKIIR